MVQRLWKSWSHDYLHQLQQRNKWKDIESNATIGDVVFLKEDNLPHLVWKKAVISDIHTGRERLTRLVTLKRAKGTLKIPVTEICLLPKVD